MQFFDLVRERYSVRSFSEEPVSDADLDAVLEAARLAPTAVNMQPIRLLVVRSEEGMKRLAVCTKYTFKAPCAVIVCACPGEAWVRPYDQENGAVVDAAIVGTHIMLAAHDRGLGSTWVGSFDPAAVREQFNVPAAVTPVAVFPLGHPSAICKPAPKHAQRKELSEMVVREHF